MEYVTLNNGLKMPMEGFGVFQVPDPAQCEQAVLDAIASGYRLIDTAAAYMNEKAVGEAVKKCGVPRGELFITTKLWIQDAGYEEAGKAIRRSLDNLGLDYLDLYLIHQPMGDYIGAYRAMEEAYKEGKLRAIGVSNFTDVQLANLVEFNEIAPMVNQIEVHPFCQQRDREALLNEYGVRMEAWAPLAEAKNDIFENETLKAIGAKYGKTVAQVILRWHVQRGVVAIPKSVHKERIEENFNIWDFQLAQEDMDAIAALDTKESLYGSTFTSAASVKMLKGLKVHD